MKEKQKALIRKNNMKLYPIYQMLGLDYLFYYGIEILFLSQVKGFSNSNIVLASSIFAIFSILTQIPMVVVLNKIGKKSSMILRECPKRNRYHISYVLYKLFNASISIFYKSYRF